MSKPKRNRLWLVVNEDTGELLTPIPLTEAKARDKALAVNYVAIMEDRPARWEEKYETEIHRRDSQV